MRRIYFDNNATTPVLPAVFEAMRPFFDEQFGNASSIHYHGQQTRAAVEEARERVSKLLGCHPSEVIFTSGGTEADNLAITGLVRPGDHIITSTIEHHAVLLTCQNLEKNGCQVTYVPVDGKSLVDPDDVRRALRPNTRLISVMMANNETGVLQPVGEIGKIAAERGNHLVEPGRAQRFDLRRDAAQLFLKLRKFKRRVGLLDIICKLRRSLGRCHIHFAGTK